MFNEKDKEIVDLVVDNFSPVTKSIRGDIGIFGIGDRRSREDTIVYEVTLLLRAFYRHIGSRDESHRKMYFDILKFPDDQLFSEIDIVQHIYEVLKNSIEVARVFHTDNYAYGPFANIVAKLRPWNYVTKRCHGIYGVTFGANPMINKNLNEILFHEDPGVEAFIERRKAIGKRNSKRKKVKSNKLQLRLNSLFADIIKHEIVIDYSISNYAVQLGLGQPDWLILFIEYNENKNMFKINKISGHINDSLYNSIHDMIKSDFIGDHLKEFNHMHDGPKKFRSAKESSDLIITLLDGVSKILKQKP